MDPQGPGLRRRDKDEKSRRHLRFTKAKWNLNSMTGLTRGAKLGDPVWAHEQRCQAEDESMVA